MVGIHYFQAEDHGLRFEGADSPPNCFTACYKLPQCLLDRLKKPTEPLLLQKAEMHFYGSRTGYSSHDGCALSSWQHQTPTGKVFDFGSYLCSTLHSTLWGIQVWRFSKQMSLTPPSKPEILKSSSTVLLTGHNQYYSF